MVVNPEPRFAARDLAVVATGGDFLVAALDARNSSLSFYSRGPGGTFTRRPARPCPGTLPAAPRRGDLNGDGRDDLVVVAAAPARSLSTLQDAAGGFGPAPDLHGRRRAESLRLSSWPTWTATAASTSW